MARNALAHEIHEPAQWPPPPGSQTNMRPTLAGKEPCDPHGGGTDGNS